MSNMGTELGNWRRAGRNTDSTSPSRKILRRNSKRVPAERWDEPRERQIVWFCVVAMGCSGEHRPGEQGVASWASPPEGHSARVGFGVSPAGKAWRVLSLAQKPKVSMGKGSRSWRVLGPRSRDLDEGGSFRPWEFDQPATPPTPDPEFHPHPKRHPATSHQSYASVSCPADTSAPSPHRRGLALALAALPTPAICSLLILLGASSGVHLSVRAAGVADLLRRAAGRGGGGEPFRPLRCCSPSSCVVVCFWIWIWIWLWLWL
ncbi:hypothetical protein JHW43_009534 [Diplocarpon mali]|nr:hypothetical protein JHW43_009534 [Diplocarpon mali]